LKWPVGQSGLRGSGPALGSRIERRFVGLGAFSGDANPMRIEVESGKSSPGRRFGLVAVALLAGIDDEELRAAQVPSGS
jgi:hypothetical protein